MGKLTWLATLTAFLAPVAADSMEFGAESFVAVAVSALPTASVPPAIATLAAAFCGLAMLKPAAR